MSRWTHLGGIIRIDNMLRVVAPSAPTAEDVIKILLKDAPVGSEGGCLLHFVEWPEVEDFKEKDHTNVYEGSLYWGDAIISADLRDVGDDDGEIEAIKQWFTSLAQKFWDAKLIMRQAVLEIEVEYKYHRILQLVDQVEDTWIDTTTLKEEAEVVRIVDHKALLLMEDGHWREDADEAWNDYIWGGYDRTDEEEEKAKDKLFKLLMKARDINLISVGRKPRQEAEEAEEQ